MPHARIVLWHTVIRPLLEVHLFDSLGCGFVGYSEHSHYPKVFHYLALQFNLKLPKPAFLRVRLWPVPISLVYSVLHNIGKHDYRRNSVLPYHFPEVLHGFLERGLGCYILAWPGNTRDIVCVDVVARTFRILKILQLHPGFLVRKNVRIPVLFLVHSAQSCTEVRFIQTFRGFPFNALQFPDPSPWNSVHFLYYLLQALGCSVACHNCQPARVRTKTSAGSMPPKGHYSEPCSRFHSKPPKPNAFVT
mmetsp:Transcript_41948/g.164355  ORF Transcript_41948/g.164355 Transcript_41948/m.164355 type:complete len:248 (+) Transcript_41948:762-1505(+)